VTAASESSSTRENIVDLSMLECPAK